MPDEAGEARLVPDLAIAQRVGGLGQHPAGTLLQPRISPGLWLIGRPICQVISVASASPSRTSASTARPTSARRSSNGVVRQWRNASRAALQRRRDLGLGGQFALDQNSPVDRGDSPLQGHACCAARSPQWPAIYASRSTDVSNSISPSRLLTASPMLISPARRPFSTTGM